MSESRTPTTIHDAPPRLVVITDTAVAPPAVLTARIERVLSLAPPSTVLVQLRDNALPFRERRALGEALAAACTRHRQWFAVNDRADLAVVLDARGVHLGERSVEAVDARLVLPAGTWVSRACHDPEAATAMDTDAVLLSPIMAERKGQPALGLAGITAARRALDAHFRSGRPRLYALGGVEATTARSCLDAGADGVAVIGAVLRGDDPAPLLAALGIVRP